MMQTVKKAFKVWHDGMISENPHEGYRIDELPIVFASTPGMAKVNATEPKGFPINNKDCTFTDLKVKRAHGADIVIFEGEEKSRWQVEAICKKRKIIAKRRRLVQAFPDGTCFYVQNGYVGNSVLWWGKNGNGYVTDITRAELYTKKEILEGFVSGREEDIIWEASHVLSNVKQHVDGQYLKREFCS